MLKKISVTIALAIMATPAHAGLGDMLKKQLQQALKQPTPDAAPTSAAVPATKTAAAPPESPTAAPIEPRADPSVTDRFVTRKDAHGHDYDAKTGLLICLAKPRNYKAGAYALSYSQTTIPEGHNPNLMCITADREYTRI